MSDNPEIPKPSVPPVTPAVIKPAAPGPAFVVQTPGGPKSTGRRKFLSWFVVAWVSFAAATMGALSLVLRFMFPNVLFEPPTSFKAGFPDDYDVGTVDTRWKEKYGTFLVKTPEGMYALSITCTHLGCTVNWLGTENKFKCLFPVVYGIHFVRKIIA